MCEGLGMPLQPDLHSFNTGEFLAPFRSEEGSACRQTDRCDQSEEVFCVFTKAVRCFESKEELVLKAAGLLHE